MTISAHGEMSIAILSVLFHIYGLSLPAQHHNACDDDDEANRQPQRCQHPHPLPCDKPHQTQADEQQRKALKEVRAVDGDVLVFHDLPPLDWLFMFLPSGMKSPTVVHMLKSLSVVSITTIAPSGHTLHPLDRA